MWECFSLEFPLPLNALFKTYQNFQPINFPPHLNMLKPAFPYWNLKLISLVLLDVSRDRLVFRAKEGRGSVLPANCHHSMTHPLETFFSMTHPFNRMAELGSLWLGTKMVMKIFVKRVFTISATNASFLRVIANLQRGSPLCSSSEQGGSKRLLEEFFWKSDHTVVCSLAANGENV